jgi:phosphatidate cytidylyltransferase
VGRFFGKTPLYPAVSPKKTRAGLFGAVLGAVSAGLLASLWYAPVLPVLDAVVLGVLSGFLGQAGDLTESLLKRSTGIKDSGGILPGHGGMLDRIDALLVITPVVYLYTLTGLGR